MEQGGTSDGAERESGRARPRITDEGLRTSRPATERRRAPGYYRVLMHSADHSAATSRDLFPTPESETPAPAVSQGGSAGTQALHLVVESPIPADSAMSVRRLCTSYCVTEFVHGLSMDASRRSSYTIVAPNGTSKTTTFSKATGLLRPTDGTAQ